MLTRLIAEKSVKDLFGVPLIGLTNQDYKRFRTSIGITEPYLLPDKKIATILEHAKSEHCIDRLQYSNVFGFYTKESDNSRWVFDAKEHYSGYDASHVHLNAIENESRRNQISMYFKSVLDKATLGTTERAMAQQAYNACREGHVDQALDMYLSFKWVDLRVRVALVQIIYHAQDISMMSLKIETDPRNGKELVVAIRPKDHKRCVFQFNKAHPALSGWTI